MGNVLIQINLRLALLLFKGSPVLEYRIYSISTLFNLLYRLRLLQTFAGAFQKKIRTRAVF